MREGPRTVLLLDDEPMILMDMQFAFDDAGFEPVLAATASRALAELDRTRVDVAVLDVNLGGGETCRPVAERLRADGVPFLLHSGDLDRQGEVVRAFDARIVPKPTPGDQVVEAARRLLAG